MTAPPHSEHPTRPPLHRPRSTSAPISRPPAIDGPPTADTAQDDEPRFSLSATQIMASVAAAVTAALVGSKLGVAGTVIGSGLASVISVVGGAVYGHSILFTRKQVQRAVLQVRGPEPTGDTVTEVMTTVLPARAVADDRTVVIPAVTRSELERARASGRSVPTRGPAGASPVSVVGVPTGPERGKPRRPRLTRRKLGASLLVGVAAAAAIFVGSLAAVTVVETVKGSPLSGGDSGGLSVLGGNPGTGGSGDRGTSEVPVTTLTEATTEQVTARSTVTQTVTSEKSTPAPATSQLSRPSTRSSTTATASSSAAPPASSTPAAPLSSTAGAPPSAAR